MKTKSIHFRLSESDYNRIRSTAVYLKKPTATFMSEWISMTVPMANDGFFEMMGFLSEKTGRSKGSLIMGWAKSVSEKHGFKL